MIQFTVFAIIQIALLPLTIIGYVFLVAKILRHSKKYGVSATSSNPLFARWMMHLMGLRDDEDGARMIGSLPFMSRVGFWMFLGPSFIAYRICGYVPSLVRIPEPGKESLASFINSRTVFFDEVMQRHINSMDQVVFMGAGFDTRAFKYCKRESVKVFELDKANTQQCKIEALKRAGIDYEWITFVPVDFNEESWVEKLVEAGFDTSKRTFFLWEGVTLYLEEEIVKQTLRAAVDSSGKGSAITFDFYSKAFVTGAGHGYFFRGLFKYYGRRVLRMSGESLGFGIDTTGNTKEAVEALLNEAGLALGELRMMGRTTEKKKPFAGLVEAVKT